MADKQTRRHRIQRTFLTGLLIFLPLFVTVWVIRFGLSLVSDGIAPYLAQAMRLSGFGVLLEQGWMPWIIPVVSVLLLLLGIYLLGLLGANAIGRLLLRWLDRAVRTIPVVRGIYSATQQFLDTFSGDKRAFSKAVLVEYPRKGLWTMALLTGDTEGEVPRKTGIHMASVFIPTTPNPTSGWLLFVPRADIIELEMSVDEAFKMIISGGVLTPADAVLKKTEPLTA